MRPALSARQLEPTPVPLSSPPIEPVRRAIESSEDVWELLDFDTYVIEPDVLWADPYDSSGGQIHRLLRALQKRVLFASHAVDCNREVTHVKLAGADVCTRARDIYTVAYATGAWLERHRFRRVYLIGGAALEDALIARAISYDGRGSDDDNCAHSPAHRMLMPQTTLPTPHRLPADSTTRCRPSSLAQSAASRMSS